MGRTAGESVEVSRFWTVAIAVAELHTEMSALRNALVGGNFVGPQIALFPEFFDFQMKTASRTSSFGTAAANVSAPR